jgi:hypothetical protein
MADTSIYSIEERLVASVWVRERQHTGQTMSQVMAAFRERFNKAPNYTYVSDSNQVMVAYWSVYGDFSAILYILIKCKGTAFLYRPITGPEVSRVLKLPDFEVIGIRTW